MAREYYTLNTYHSAGTIGISRHVFEEIATLAANDVQDASVATRKDKNGKAKKGLMEFFALAQPVRANFLKGGKVEINIDVNIKGKERVHEVCLNIQEKVSNAIAMMCETVPVDISIKVVGIH